LAGRHLAGGGEAIFAEFRLGGGTLFVASEALFVPSACDLAAGSARLADALVAVGIGRVAKERAWCELVARGDPFDSSASSEQASSRLDVSTVGGAISTRKFLGVVAQK
jgi:hypothetical protein